MTIKIDCNQGAGPIRSTEGTARVKDSSKSEPTANGDKVVFSAVLQDVNRARQSSSQDDVLRMEKVQALREQVADGSYRPDLTKVATSLLKYLAGAK